VILTIMYLTSAKNSDSWHARKGDLQHAFPLDIPMVPSLALTVTDDGERLSCGGFSLSETIHFGRLEFIADGFGGLSLSHMGDGSDTIVMASTCGGPPSPLWAMTGDSIEEFHKTSNGEGRIDLPSPRRHDTVASPAPATTTSWPESTPAAQATKNILLRQATPWLDTDLLLERRGGQAIPPTGGDSHDHYHTTSRVCPLVPFRLQS
jgi:hypothetical protein